MAKRHLLILGLLLSGGAFASACSDTKATSIEGDAGAGGEAGEKNQGGSSNAGSGNGGSGNATGDAGADNAGGEGGMGGVSGEGGEGGGEPPYEFPASLNPQDVLVVGTASGASTKLLVQASDYQKTTEHKNGTGEIVSITIASGAVGDSVTYEDSDLLALSSAGIGFALERTNDKLHQLDGGKISKTVDLKDPGTNEPVTGTKAYVPFYNQSLIAVVDLSEGTVSHRIDLNAYNAPGDSDHSADITEAVYDANSKIAYFLLQRIDINSINPATNYQLRCTKNRALIVGIDTRVDEIIDLNGDAAGKGIELSLVNPRSLSINADGDTLYMLAEGCYDGDHKALRGIEVVDLSDGSTTVAYQAAGDDYLARMIKTTGSDALIESLGDATHWHKIDLAQGTLGNEIANVPQAPSFDGADLLGVEVTAKVGKVVRYKIATETSTEISPTSWGGEYSSASSTALVK